jgi:hypothetical protein
LVLRLCSKWWIPKWRVFPWLTDFTQEKLHH